MFEILMFIFSFFVILILYEVFVVPRAKKNFLLDEKKYPIEIKFLISEFNIDLNKINYNNLLHIISIVSSLDISVIVSISGLFNKYIYQLLCSIILVFPLIIFSYGLVGYIYKKKGLIKNV